MSVLIITSRLLLGRLLADTVGPRFPQGGMAIRHAGYAYPLDTSVPDRVLVDAAGLEGASPCDVIERAVSCGPDVRVVLLVEATSDLLLRTARSAGACAAGSVSDEPDVIADLLVTARRGEFRVSATASPPPSRRFLPCLTDRQREVYELALVGKTDEEIAGALGIATSTAETHRQGAMAALGCHSHADLVAHGLRHGMLTAERLPPESTLRRCSRVRERRVLAGA